MTFTFKLSRRLVRLRSAAASLIVLAMGAVACSNDLPPETESAQDPSVSIAANTPLGTRVKTTGNANVLAAPAKSGAILGTQPKGANGTLVGGPVKDTLGDNHIRWQVDFDSGVDGWLDKGRLTYSSVPAPSGTVASVTVTPATASVVAGSTVQLTATAQDASGNTLSGQSFSWSTGNSGVATVSSSGLVTGVAAGTVTITAATGGKSGTATVTVTVPPPPPPSGSEVLVGAGDISSCSQNNDEATARLLDNIPGTVFTAGDNAYSSGTTSEYSNCYGPTWGRHKARTRPAIGNHDFSTSSGAPYYAYFGGNAGPAGLGYYSYDLGAWHIIVINSNIPMSAGSTQETWLKADLAASSKQCTIAMWHHPRFSSGSNHGSDPSSGPLWTDLYNAGAEIVISGHDHTYERFGPQTPSAASDPANGIREFIVGTGGESHYGFGTPLPNSQVRNGDTFGVLKLTLSDGSYTWGFIPVAGSTFTDSGSGTCH